MVGPTRGKSRRSGVRSARPVLPHGKSPPLATPMQRVKTRSKKRVLYQSKNQAVPSWVWVAAAATAAGCLLGQAVAQLLSLVVTLPHSCLDCISLSHRSPPEFPFHLSLLSRLSRTSLLGPSSVAIPCSCFAVSGRGSKLLCTAALMVPP